MSYIYLITNILNGKKYIGKTVRTPEKRFDEHCRDADNGVDRPLQAAIRKYGRDNFKIEVIEKCDTLTASDRERYWIEYYRSFKQGYNATLGGDGVPYLDYDLIVATYLETKSIYTVAELCHCDRGSVSRIVKEQGIELFNSRESTITGRGKPIGQYDLNDNLIATYRSGGEAARKNGLSTADSAHIRECANGKRPTAYGWKWKFL